MFSILARLGLDSTGFRIGVKGAEDSVNKFGKDTLGGLKSQIAGAFGAGAIIAFTKSVVEHADKIGDLADQTGLTTDQVQELNAVISKFGIDFGQLQVLIEKLREARREALGGSEDFKRAFKSVGIDDAKLKSLKDANDLVRAVGKGLGGFTAESKSAILTQLAGIKAGPKFQGALVELGEGAPSGEIAMDADSIARLSKVSDELAAKWRELLVISGGGILDFFDSVNWHKSVDAKTLEAPKSVLGVTMFPLKAAAFGLGKLFPAEDENASKPLNGFKTLPGKPTKDELEKQAKRIAALKEIREIEKQMADFVFQQNLKSLTVANQRAALTKKIKISEQEAADLAAFGFDAEARKKQFETLKLRDQLNGIQDEKINRPKPEQIGNQVTDLQKIGAQVSSSNESFTIMRQQLAEQKRTTAAVLKVETKLADGGFN